MDYVYATLPQKLIIIIIAQAMVTVSNIWTLKILTHEMNQPLKLL